MIGPGAHERGTALIAALLLVALMAAVAVQLVDLTRFAVFRTSQIDNRAQTYWMARGARELAESAFLAAGDPGRAVMRSDESWLDEAVVFPLEDGFVSGQVRDGNNCLNLNALVAAPSDAPREAEQADAQTDWVRTAFAIVSEEIGVGPGQAATLLAQITDWIDPDTQAEPGGAEDRLYGQLTPPYRSANQPFVELQELRALPVMTPALYALYQPYLCVRPDRAQPPLNINTLSLDQAVLLSAVYGEALPLADAETVLFRRPPAGYDTLDEVWADPLIAGLELDDAAKARLTLRSRWLVMEMRVRRAETRFDLMTLAELSEGGQLRRHNQRFGAF